MKDLEKLDAYMPSFDIESISTNIPLEEPINVRQIFHNKTKVNYSFEKSFKFPLELDTLNSFYYFPWKKNTNE